MEDTYTVELDLDKSGNSNSYFAVYDGHGGNSVANFVRDNMHKRLVQNVAYREKNWKVALKNAFLETDKEISGDPELAVDHLRTGTTAVTALVTQDKKILVANAGDARCIISVNGVAQPLSQDHKPTVESESARISKAGGYVSGNKRVNGNLSLARALGDFMYKHNESLSQEDQIITANPDIVEHPVTDEDEFLVLACDGIWDCMTSQQVADTVRLQVSKKMELDKICEFICDLCVAPYAEDGASKGTDNMTVIIVALLNGRTKEQWYKLIANRVAESIGYKTPADVPQIYSPATIEEGRRKIAARKAMDEENEKWEEDATRGNPPSKPGGNFGFPNNNGLRRPI